MLRHVSLNTIRYWRLVAATCCVLLGATGAQADDSLAKIAREVQAKVVKVYGAGGVSGLEAYQSGMLISAEGDILTAWSYVLDSDEVTVVLDDGRRFTAKLLGADPLTEVAVLKIDPGNEALPHFDLHEAPASDVGARVLALSNLFGIATGDEPVSVLQGYVSAVAPLEARRGGFSTNFRGDVYIIDATVNNPGASGGALVDVQGRLVGMLGKELRSELTGTWLNYALPVAAIAPTMESIRAGDFTPRPLTEADRPDHPLSLAALGIVLVPDVVSRTPPYIDRVLPDSPAARADLRPDDLVVMIDAHVVASRRQADEYIRRLEQDSPVRISVLRNDTLVEVTLAAAPDDSPETKD